jgi:hypothetical protein
MNSQFIIYVGERAASTFVQAFVGVLGSVQLADLDVSILETALVAGISAAASILKSAAASKGPLGSSSASLAE